MGAANAKIYFLEDFMASANHQDKTTTYGEGGGYGQSPGQRLRRHVERLHRSLQWHLENAKEPEVWEAAARMQKKEPEWPRHIFAAINKCRRNKTGTPEDLRELRRLLCIFYENDLEAVEVSFKHELIDPKLAIHGFREMLFDCGIPISPAPPPKSTD